MRQSILYCVLVSLQLASVVSSVQCTLGSAQQEAQLGLQCTLNSVQCTLNSVQFTLYIEQYTVYSVRAVYGWRPSQGYKLHLSSGLCCQEMCKHDISTQQAFITRQKMIKKNSRKLYLFFLPNWHLCWSRKQDLLVKFLPKPIYFKQTGQAQLIKDPLLTIPATL